MFAPLLIDFILYDLKKSVQFIVAYPNVQKPEQEEKTGIRESVADAPTPYPVENARHDYTVGNGGLRVVAAMADKPVQRASLKEKLEAFKVRAAGAGKPEIGKAKGKEETL